MSFIVKLGWETLLWSPEHPNQSDMFAPNQTCSDTLFRLIFCSQKGNKE